MSLALFMGFSLHLQGQDEVVVPSMRKTSVSIVGDEFWISGKPTYEGVSWKGKKIQGLLLNTRMVQGIFDDRNPETVKRWAYPDTGRWDAERNVREFIDAMSDWRNYGVLGFTINLQGGSPEGYSKDQPWLNSAIEADGSLRADYMGRLERILDKADELGMVAILGCFYFGQDERLKDEAAVTRALDNVLQWLFEKGYRNVLIEINNECNVKYDHNILKPDRVHELINRVRDTTRNHRRFYVGTSYGGGTLPDANVVRVSDFLLMHGNGVSDPNRIAEMVRKVRTAPGYLMPKPILFNEDDHFDFDKPNNNFAAAISEYASWGFFDPGTNNYADGYQSPPVKWTINTPRKRAFFQLAGEITGSIFGTPAVAATPSAAAPAVASAAITITNGAYHGWTNAWFLNNGLVQAVVVPAIGRVMQFSFIGEEGVFWENRELDGKSGDWKSGWANFGGDKTWPSPEGEWAKFTRREGWCPPPAFDSLPVEAKVEGSDLLLTSPIDPFYAIRVRRRIHLEADQPAMTITTTYERVVGEAAQIGIWVITQLKEPVKIFAPVPAITADPNKYVLLMKETPSDVKVDRGLLSLSRNSKKAHKIGLESGTLLWIGEKHALRIDSPRLPNHVYPDKGSSAEIYTNPDPLKYVELETLGPLHLMQGGHYIQRINTYTLFKRTQKSPEAEARKLLE